MSYDIRLIDPVTKKVIKVEPHMMYGGNVMVSENDDGVLVPVPTTEAYLNITYNYGDWYKEAFDKGEDYYNSIRDTSYVPDYADVGFDEGQGIRSIYGMTGAKSLDELEYAIEHLKDRTWHPEMDITEEELRDNYIEQIREFNSLPRDEQEYLSKMGMTPKERKLDDYWTETRDNALKPLYQLKSLAQLRPDGIWCGD